MVVSGYLLHDMTRRTDMMGMVKCHDGVAKTANYSHLESFSETLEQHLFAISNIDDMFRILIIGHFLLQDN